MKINVSVIVTDGDKVLLMQRSLNDDYCPGAWGIPGGYMEDVDTTLEDIAIREVQEEMGITIVPDNIAFNNINRDTETLYLVMSAKLSSPKDRDDIKLSDEANDYKWASFSDLENLEFTPYTKDRVVSVAQNLQTKNR